MKFKTKLEALIACRNHWQFMEITKSGEKKDYEPSSEWDNNCAVCHFAGANHVGGRNCQKCALKGFAWFEDCEEHEEDFESFYENWVECTFEDEGPQKHQRQFWANRMVYACNQAIENYLLKEI